MHSSTDRFQKQVILDAPRTRVWRALTDHREFGEWFGVRLASPFVAGREVRGEITMKDGRTVAMTAWVETIEPEHRFAFRWHPYAIEEGVDYSAEPTTLVEFMLSDAPDGTMLTVTESGFDRIPLARRAQAFTANEQGWGIMVTLIDRYVAGHGA